MLDFTYDFLTLFTKLVELSPSVNYVFNFVVVIVVVTKSEREDAITDPTD